MRRPRTLERRCSMRERLSCVEKYLWLWNTGAPTWSNSSRGRAGRLHLWLWKLLFRMYSSLHCQYSNKTMTTSTQAYRSLSFEPRCCLKTCSIRRKRSCPIHYLIGHSQVEYCIHEYLGQIRSSGRILFTPAKVRIVFTALNL